MAAIFPGRKTYLWLDISEKTLGRPSWHWLRQADQMAEKRARRPLRNTNVMFLRDCWILRPREAELAQTVMPPSGLGGGITGSEVTKAPGVADVLMFRSGDLSWTTPGSSVVGSGLPAFQRQIIAGATSAPALGPATAPLPSTPEPPQMYPVSRIINGGVLYPENCPFQLRFELPMTWEGGDILYRFYFGGPTDTAPSNEGGQFYAAFRGSGESRLYELDATPGVTYGWQERFKFDYSHGSAGVAQLASVMIIPHATGRIAFLAMANEFWLGGFTFGGFMATAASGRFDQMQRYIYVDEFSDTGHRHARAATGPGTVHMDQREDLRTKFSIVRMRYPSQADGQFGVLVDAPFVIDYPVPYHTAMRLQIDAYLMPGTNVLGAIYDATTNIICDQEPLTGYWFTNANQREYYVVLTLTSIDGIQTPVVWGYNVRVAGDYRINVREPIRVDIESVRIEGPDIDPSHEEAMVVCRDIKDQLAILRQRDRIRCWISLHDPLLADPGDPGAGLICHLFEGETASPEGEWMGKAGSIYPDPQWRDYRNLRLVGLWARCSDQLSLHVDNFAVDQSAPLPNGLYPPWKVTSAIRHIFNNLGFDTDELDVPDLGIRFWLEPDAGAKAPDYLNFQLAAGTDPAGAIRTLAWDYLGMVMLRDANAGPRGMWRLVLNPSPPYNNTLLDIYIQPPDDLSGKRLAHVNAVYDDPDGYVSTRTYAITWRTWVKAPEVNVVTVQGGQEGGGQAGTGKLTYTLINNRSIEDASYLGYLGRPVTVVFPVNPHLSSPAAVVWVCRRIFNEAAIPKIWFEVTVPMVLVYDPLDLYQLRPRLPHLNDVIRVGYDDNWLPAMVRSVKVEYRSDNTQLCTIQGLLLDLELTGPPAAWGASDGLRENPNAAGRGRDGAREARH